MGAPGNKTGHAEILIVDSQVMMADDCGKESPFCNPQSLGGSSVGLHIIYMVTGLALWKTLFGHVWFVAAHKEDLSPDEIRKRAEASSSKT